VITRRTALSSGGIGLLTAIPVPRRTRQAAGANATRLPVAHSLRQHVPDGGLLSDSSDLAALSRYSAKWAHRILLRARPAELPVEPSRETTLGRGR
jgi:ABC-type uncharacterized transport system substrate-binding protein